MSDNPRCFIAYWVNPYDKEKSVPIAIGLNKADVLGDGVRIVLLLCILDGGVGVQEHNDLNAREIEEVKTMLEGFYIKWGIHDALDRSGDRPFAETDGGGEARCH
jgi:hypothetical protein